MMDSLINSSFCALCSAQRPYLNVKYKMKLNMYCSLNKKSHVTLTIALSYKSSILSFV